MWTYVTKLLYMSISQLCHHKTKHPTHSEFTAEIYLLHSFTGFSTYSPSSKAKISRRADMAEEPSHLRVAGMQTKKGRTRGKDTLSQTGPQGHTSLTSPTS